MSRKNVKERAEVMKGLRARSREELRDELKELRREQFKLRMAAAKLPVPCMFVSRQVM